MCYHNNFHTTSTITRIVDDGFVVSEFRLDIKVHCVECGLPFEFVGPPCGISDIEPTTSYDRKELRMPIKASSDPVDNAKSILNQSIKNSNK
jgi:hypothetical protein